VNDIALNTYEETPTKITTLLVGSIVLKENFRTPPPNNPHFIELVELPIMYKAQDESGVVRWFWEKHGHLAL
jgi:hypothetical protein